MTLAELSALEAVRAEAEFLRCCGSVRWARGMGQARPFASLNAMIEAGEVLWAALAPGDWLEAFAAHPQIGARTPASAWAAGEQSGMRSADDQTRARLAASNAAYRSRFGFIFIVCATGKSPAEMLAMLERRLANSPEGEL